VTLAWYSLVRRFRSPVIDYPLAKDRNVAACDISATPPPAHRHDQMDQGCGKRRGEGTGLRYRVLKRSAARRPTGDHGIEGEMLDQPISTALVVAINALAAFVALLRLDRKRRDRARLQPLYRDRLAGFIAIAVAAVFDALQRRVDLGDQLALPVTGAQLDGPVGLR
jgi:hypothetical protein